MLAVVVGASGGIGAAMVEALRHEPDVTSIIATFRSTQPAPTQSALTQSDKNLSPATATPVEWYQLELTDESAIVKFADHLRSKLSQQTSVADDPQPGLRYFINCAGVLHNDQLSPEKTVRSFTSEALATSVAINATPTLLLARELGPLLKQESHAVYATVSAKVGSISDNRLGGWYSYRMSKAALNMAIRTLAVEWQRLYPQVSVVALHPGTTATALSKPFQRNVPGGKLFSADKTANFLMAVMRSLTPGRTGEFLSWDGTPIPW